MTTTDLTLHDHDRQIQYDIAVSYSYDPPSSPHFDRYYGGDPGSPEAFHWRVCRVDAIRFGVILSFAETGKVVRGWAEATLTLDGCEAVVRDIENRWEEFDEQVVDELRKVLAGRN